MINLASETLLPYISTSSLYMYSVLVYLVGPEMELSFHDGTVRDMVFMQDTINRSSLLISGGAGDCKIYVTDCETGMPVRAMAGHSGMNFQENIKNFTCIKKSI